MSDVFEKLELKHLGLDAEDGVLIVDEIDQAMREIGGLVRDERYGKAGSITLTIDISQDGDQTVRLTPKLKVKLPARKRASMLAYPDERGQLRRYKSEQLSLPEVPRIGVEGPRTSRQGSPRRAVSVRVDRVEAPEPEPTEGDEE